MKAKRYEAKTRDLTKHGMNWIRQEKRLAIYMRDGFSCAWCGMSVEDGASLTLDHLITRKQGGGHHQTNLVTACARCNQERGETPWRQFGKWVVAEFDFTLDADAITSHVNRCRLRPLENFRIEAREIIDARGSAAKAVAARLHVRNQKGGE